MSGYRLKDVAVLITRVYWHSGRYPVAGLRPISAGIRSISRLGNSPDSLAIRLQGLLIFLLMARWTLYLIQVIGSNLNSCDESFV